MGDKHQWLYLNTLDSAKTVEKLVAFYVQEHKERLPHAAFRAQSPDEMYWGTGVSVPTELELLGNIPVRRERTQNNGGSAARANR